MWIPTPGGQAFAWYHPSQAARSREHAVLLCDPFGMDRMVLHLTYRHLALRLAAEGFHVLRMDYPGTCDSEGMPRESARVETWLGSLNAAADRLRDWSGARELALCGVLLGGTLGVLLAARRPDVSALVLWGPYVRGSAAVRAGVAASVTSDSNPQGREPSTAVDGDQEALGFLLTRSMIADLQSIDLLQVSPGSVRSALVLARSATSPEPALASHLASAGISVDLRETAPDGLDEVLHRSGAGYAEQAIEEMAAWLMRESPGLVETRPVERSALGPREVLLRESGNALVRESVVYLGSDGGVFGIVSEPAEHAPREPSLVLVNGGHNHRAGINRNYTEWARALAARGHRVLRIDVRGLGDSAPAQPQHLGELYRDETRDDVLDAVRWLRQRGGGHVACAGLCAGAYQAFQAAVADASIASVIMLNPLRFNEVRLEAVGVHAHAADYWRQLDGRKLDPKALVRLVARLVREGVRRYLPVASRLRRAGRRIARSFVALTGRGTDLLVVYNDNEPTLTFLQHSLRPFQRSLEATGSFRLETLGHADHIFSPLWFQEAVGKVLLEHVAKLSSRLPAS